MSAEQNKQAQIILEYKKQALHKHLLQQGFFKVLRHCEPFREAI